MEKIDEDARLLYVLLRHAMNLDQAEFAAATRTAASQVSLYERGERPLPREILERAADEYGFPRGLLGPAKRAIRSFRVAAPRGGLAPTSYTNNGSGEVLTIDPPGDGTADVTTFTYNLPGRNRNKCLAPPCLPVPLPP